ncbi:tyrosyl-DNA phosphodiesterase [Nitzschia inconspicua]|uniref:Tyrosyl-DNA phosphodiesterase n=1 Tax=Nitzschia inconspicua TaxID=303405 RepID=A0A9K3KSP3_9STRA|nr:tyrosyl-DNA phosphodiesterase [Nitzschia inconspicua]
MKSSNQGNNSIEADGKSVAGPAAAESSDVVDNNTNKDRPSTSTTANAGSALPPSLKRPLPIERDNIEMTSSDKKKAAVDMSNNNKQPTKSAYRPEPNCIDGCMLTPQNPIKIFATHQDEQKRKSMKTDPDKERHYTFEHCWTLREMMGLDRFSGICHEGLTMEQLTKRDATIGIDFVLVATYILNVDCLYSELPELTHVPNVVVIYEYKDPNESGSEEMWRSQARRDGHNLLFIQRSPKAEPRTKFNKDNHDSVNPLYCLMEYGCHHTKMFLVKYASGRLRVNIHTSNLRDEDVHLKCQGAFIQDFLPKTQEQLDMFESSDFEETLVTYMESYHILDSVSWTHPSSTIAPPNNLHPQTLVQHLQTYDFSTAVGVLIPSIPGYHNFSGIEKFGYVKVEQCVQKYCQNKNGSGTSNPVGGPIVCQCSSIGALSVPYLSKLFTAWNVSYAGKGCPPPKGITGTLFKIVWPTLQEIATSVEGVNGGGTVPGRIRNLVKPYVRMLLHKWTDKSPRRIYSNVGRGGGITSRNNTLDKGCNVPHIKTYYQISRRDPQGDEEMEWFVLSSHNLSKAAWGEIQNRRLEGEVLTVQHWELGVFVSPETLGVDHMGPLPETAMSSVAELASTRETNAKRRTVIPLPYKFRPDAYDEEDQFWATDLFGG